MQIGLRDLNREHGTKFRLERSANMLRLLAVMQLLTGKWLHHVEFVSAEDYEGFTKNEHLYRSLQSKGASLDIRDYKFKNFVCTNCDHKGKQKVQAEVDVAIAVKLIQFAQMAEVSNLILFAGDRDFFDAIRYV